MSQDTAAKRRKTIARGVSPWERIALKRAARRGERRFHTSFAPPGLTTTSWQTVFRGRRPWLFSAAASRLMNQGFYHVHILRTQR